MTYLALPLLAFISGIAIAAQAVLNAQLGQVLKNPIYATAVAFFSSLIFISLAIVVLVRRLPEAEAVRSVPVYLWFSGGILSAFGIACFYWLIPKMGAGPMVSIGLTGQLIFAVLASHFGWLQLPVVSITGDKALGVCALLIGVYLINRP
ncbi:DMT family transporter [Kiloniella antarctica]|uniref:DMT family transporter n=1 Tax=Kiloniella antarctica TaxID=1550907 RepID=A0ABW5BQC1_9PROT